MRSPFIQPILTIACVLAFLAGCGIQLQSPIKISRNKEEEKKEAPSETAVYASPPQPSSRPTPDRHVAESPSAARSPDDILIVSSSYWAGIDRVLGPVTIKDVSGEGLSENEAIEALKIEAFHSFGSQAGGIINLSFDRTKNWMGADAVTVARGDVVAWSDLVSAPSSNRTSVSGVHQTHDALSAAVPSPESPSRGPSSSQTQSTKTHVSPADLQTAQGTSTVSSPAAVLILSDQDLVDYEFWAVGRISVFGQSGDEFNLKEANQALKAEAFRRYGAQARGVINTSYKKKSRLFRWGEDKFSEASGDVVTWGEHKGAGRSAP